jgi:hypothetical protein
MRYRRSNHPGVCLTPFVALTGFLTLTAPCSPPDRPALFHAGSVPGVHPSEPSPSEEPYRLSAANALLMLTRHPRHHMTRPCHTKRAETRCSHPVAVRLLPRGFFTLRLTPRSRSACSARPSTSRSRRPVPLGLATAGLATACASRRRPKSQARPHTASLPSAPGLASGSLGHKARGLLWSVPDTPRGWHGLVTPHQRCRSTPDSGLETPPVPAPRPRDSRCAPGPKPVNPPVTAWVRSLGRRSGSLPAPGPCRSTSRKRGSESNRQSNDPGQPVPDLARTEARALPDPRLPFLLATRRPSRVGPPRRSATSRHARADTPVPPPRPPLAPSSTRAETHAPKRSACGRSCQRRAQSHRPALPCRSRTSPPLSPTRHPVTDVPASPVTLPCRNTCFASGSADPPAPRLRQLPVPRPPDRSPLAVTRVPVELPGDPPTLPRPHERAEARSW